MWFCGWFFHFLELAGTEMAGRSKMSLFIRLVLGADWNFMWDFLWVFERPHTAWCLGSMMVHSKQRGENCSFLWHSSQITVSCPEYAIGQRSPCTSPDLFGNKCLLSVEERQRMCRHQSTLYPQMIYIPLTWKPHPLPSPALCPKFYSTMASSSGLKSRILSSKSCSEYYGTTPLRFLEAFLSSWEEALP